MVSTHLKNMLVKLEIFPKCLPLYQRICLNNIPHFDVQRTISVNQRSQFLKLPNKKSLGYNGTYTGLEAQLRIFKAEGNSTHPKQKKKHQGTSSSVRRCASRCASDRAEEFSKRPSKVCISSLNLRSSNRWFCWRPMSPGPSERRWYGNVFFVSGSLSSS